MCWQVGGGEYKIDTKAQVSLGENNMDLFSFWAMMKFVPKTEPQNMLDTSTVLGNRTSGFLHFFLSWFLIQEGSGVLEMWWKARVKFDVCLSKGPRRTWRASWTELKGWKGGFMSKLENWDLLSLWKRNLDGDLVLILRNTKGVMRLNLTSIFLLFWKLK